MRLQAHLVASTAVGGAVWAGTGNPATLPIAIAAGVLPDGDHLLDYYFRYVRRDRRFVFLLLHAWEYFFIGLILYLFVWNEPWMLAIVAGYASQLVLDQISHGKGGEWTMYLITFRAARRFASSDRDRRPRRREYKSLIDSLPFGGQAVERWLEKRLWSQERRPPTR